MRPGAVTPSVAHSVQGRMKPALPLLLVLAALLGAGPAAALPLDEARHLLARTGFAASPAEIEALSPLTRAQAIERVLGNTRTVASTRPPTWVDDRPGPRPTSEAERRARRQRWRAQAFELMRWWLGEMIATDSPVTERMVLFWHGHFTTSAQKVKASPLLYRQNVLLRRHALGDFRTLLHAIARDPAMLLYLDGARNRRGKPNENFAREVIELFTLGEGNYTETDIKEAARAFAGWSVQRSDRDFVERRRWRDQGPKEVLGLRGNLDGDAVLDALLAHPRTAQRIVEKLWRHFVSETPEAAIVTKLADDFRRDWQIRPLLAALLGTEAFWAPAARGRLVKSPVVLVTGTLRQFTVPLPDDGRLRRLLRSLGQTPYLPPTVEGWPEGEGWIGSATALARDAALQRFVRRTAFDAWLAALPPTWRRADRVAELLCAIKPLAAPTEGPADAALVGALLTDPTYQLQ